MSQTTAESQGELKGPAFEIFIGILSVLSILNIFFIYVVEDPNLKEVLQVMNALLSVIFFGDFLYRLKTAPSRSAYFFHQWGWADLLASVPIPQAKVLRGFRLLRVFRLLRAYGARKIARALIRDRAESALLTVLMMGILVLEFGSFWILKVEQGKPGANIESASDAIWYVIVTMSTVGYGDQFPVTTAGRLVGAGVIIIGVGIFGTFTGYLANLFLSPKDADQPAPVAQPTADAATLADLHAVVLRQQAALEEMRSLLRASSPPDSP